jgi:phosphoglycolate phosphatase-like HAD superfamily hydrolase
VYDAQACQEAGVTCLGLLAGGTPEAELLEAGAVAVWRDIAHLLQDLNHALELAGLPSTVIK